MKNIEKVKVLTWIVSILLIVVFALTVAVIIEMRTPVHETVQEQVADTPTVEEVQVVEPETDTYIKEQVNTEEVSEVTHSADDQEYWEQQALDLMGTAEFSDILYNLPIGQPDGVSFISYNVTDDSIVFTYMINRSDICFDITVHEDNTLGCGDLYNRLNTGYPLVLWLIDKPTNYEDIYMDMTNNGFTDHYYTSYRSGDSRVDMFDDFNNTVYMYNCN